MELKKKYFCLLIVLMFGIIMCSCEKSDNTLEKSFVKDMDAILSEQNMTNEEEMAEQLEKGYDLLVDENEKEEAEKECKRLMELISNIYINADKGEASNVVLTEETVLKMQNQIKETGVPVTTTVFYSNMENYEEMDYFLKMCKSGKSGSVITYEIYFDGGIGRKKYIFDGTEMYILATVVIWNEDNQPRTPYTSYTRVKEWKYTDKGWFCYKLCVPEPPAVSEIVDGSCLVRVKPMTEAQREMSKRCVFELGYQGNNLLCSNWDMEHMEKLDYSGMYEYLYSMKYQEKFDYKAYPNGIPKDEFESLIMEYLPITAEKIQEYAIYDKEHHTYAWASLGCFSYSPTFFGTSVPEVTNIRENEDGTVTLTVDAVCDMIICDDAVITHELTVRFREDGSFQYLGNVVLNNGIKNIPDYQYRMYRE